MGFKARKPHPAINWRHATLDLDGQKLYRDMEDFEIFHHSRSGTFIRASHAPVNRQFGPHSDPETTFIWLQEDDTFAAAEKRIRIPWKGNWDYLYIPEQP
jgi:hypothetical protein